mgnify:FL=1
MDALYQIRVNCPCCEQSFQTSRVRPSFKKAVSRDSDFCLHYRENAANPDYYVVRVCPYCGFAFTENSVKKLTEPQRKIIMEKVTSQWKFKDYGGVRTWEDALYTFKMAVACGQLIQEKERVMAGLLHHIAWLYRYKNDEAQEKRFLELALNAYTRVYETESDSLDNARLMYLLGELNRRLKRYPEAIKWFGRVVNDKKIMDSAMIQASRAQWAVTREDMLAENQELPPEMQA